jgi:hypothetical protein
MNYYGKNPVLCGHRSKYSYISILIAANTITIIII